MVNICFLCKWRAGKEPKRTFHQFPKNKSTRKKWLESLGLPNATIGDRAMLCSAHFEDHCFRYGLVRGRRCIKDGCVPSLCLRTKTAELPLGNMSSSVTSQPALSDGSAPPIDYSEPQEIVCTPSTSALHLAKPSCSSPSLMEKCETQEERLDDLPIQVEKSTQELEYNAPIKIIRCDLSSAKRAECPSCSCSKRRFAEARRQDRRKILSLQRRVRQLRTRDLVRKYRNQFLEKKQERLEVENKLLKIMNDDLNQREIIPVAVASSTGLPVVREVIYVKRRRTVKEDREDHFVKRLTECIRRSEEREKWRVKRHEEHMEMSQRLLDYLQTLVNT